VIEAKFISYEQFMDNMQEYEISSLINMLKYANKPEWMQTRLIMYASLLPYMKKGVNKDPEDMLPMPFDEKIVMRKDITNDEIKKMSKMAEYVGRFINKIEETQNG